jgi:WD40 repeat protein
MNDGKEFPVCQFNRPHQGRLSFCLNRLVSHVCMQTHNSQNRGIRDTQPYMKQRIVSLVLVVVTGLSSAIRAQNAPDIIWQATATNQYVLNSAAVSPDGSIIATQGTNNTVQIWRTSDGARLQTLAGYGNWIGDLVFSPDGKYFASASGSTGVLVWRTANWSFGYFVSTSNQGPAVAFSLDSTTIAVGNGTAIELRRATNGALVQRWIATVREVTALAFSPDGAVLASGAGIRGMDTNLTFWQVPSGQMIRSVPTAQSYGIGYVAFSPDGRMLATGSDYLHSGPMQLWSVSDGSLLKTFPESAFSMAFSADSAVLLAVGTNITFYSTTSGALMKSYPDGPFVGSSQGEKGIAFVSGGERFVRARGFGEVFVARVPFLVFPPRIQNGQMSIRWFGGTGRYQLQSSAGLTNDWHDEGGILATNTTSIPLARSCGFYRIVALPE